MAAGLVFGAQRQKCFKWSRIALANVSRFKTDQKIDGAVQQVAVVRHDDQTAVEMIEEFLQNCQGLNIDVTGFIMDGSNMIQITRSANPPPLYSFDNTGAFRFSGIELGIVGNYKHLLKTRINHSFLDSGQQTKGRPRHKTDVNLNVTHPILNIGIVAQYLADYYAADSLQEPIDDYFIIGTKITWKLSFGLHPFFAVDNILNRKYDIYANLPGSSAGLYEMPRRTLTAGVSYSF